jgi:hypothetical protein
MKIGDLVILVQRNSDGFRTGKTYGPGIILSSWTDVQPGINIEERWFEVMWKGNKLSEHTARTIKVVPRTVALEEFNESR